MTFMIRNNLRPKANLDLMELKRIAVCSLE
uniref:Uncharacterized protein n=1 Tax=Phage sp. ctGns7 TaxID=2828003 RepID=A0A8S5SA31_9VIRU|nr:MAG TPA: hypothetical protein [Phage sp. ctGns7]